MDSLCADEIPAKEVRTPTSVAFYTRAERASMAMTNNIGEIGPPCLKPKAFMMFLPDTPLTTTFVLADYKSAAIQSNHR